MADFVLDASLALAWCFEDERTEFTHSILLRIRNGEVPTAPALWSLEVANGIRNAERRNRITPDKSKELLHFLRALPVQMSSDTYFYALRRIASLKIVPKQAR